MAKKRNNLDIPEIEVALNNKTSPNPKIKAKTKKKPNAKRKFSLGKVFKEMISELKKVDWAPFKKTKNNSGVITQTATVLVVVVFFLIFISLFDTGLTALLDLLLEAASPN
ncbi:MAG: preprotein translocase subunit SecE [Bacillota bacterium]|jgi:preprotein translocase subunit SecE|nr:preprotein translocase subunit SecE [Bacillota bacterium]HHU43842.1 hypothetical protein [Clostridiales bacterium]